MRRVPVFPVVLVAAMCMVAVAGCSSPAKEPPGLTASPSPASESPTPTPTPTFAGPTDLSDPELGVVFTGIPQVEDQSTSDAIETFMYFEIEYWKALTTNEVRPGPWVIASDEAIAWIQGNVDRSKIDGWASNGTLATSIEVVSGDETTLVLDICRDWRDAGFVNAAAGTEMTNAEAGLDETSGARVGMVLSPNSGWYVNTTERTGEC
jgi:hypothetical protein